MMPIGRRPSTPPAIRKEVKELVDVGSKQGTSAVANRMANKYNVDKTQTQRELELFNGKNGKFKSQQGSEKDNWASLYAGNPEAATSGRVRLQHPTGPGIDFIDGNRFHHLQIGMPSKQERDKVDNWFRSKINEYNFFKSQGPQGAERAEQTIAEIRSQAQRLQTHYGPPSASNPNLQEVLIPKNSTDRPAHHASGGIASPLSDEEKDGLRREYLKTKLMYVNQQSTADSLDAIRINKGRLKDSMDAMQRNYDAKQEALDNEQNPAIKKQLQQQLDKLDSDLENALDSLEELESKEQGVRDNIPEEYKGFFSRS